MPRAKAVIHCFAKTCHFGPIPDCTRLSRRIPLCPAVRRVPCFLRVPCFRVVCGSMFPWNAYYRLDAVNPIRRKPAVRAADGPWSSPKALETGIDEPLNIGRESFPMPER